MTLLNRHTNCILAWRVDGERSEGLLLAMVDKAPRAKFYYSDLFAAYRSLVYTPGRYTPMPNKSETFWVEGAPMLSSGTIWHDWPGVRVASRAAFGPCGGW